MSKTSWQVKKRYNDRVYKRVEAKIERELVEEWEERIKSDGISKAEFIRRAMKNYLKKD